ncbi:ankyrin repeat-containing domain protein [Morchella snyderi]|nr:ankyrin repeat-containing domain protein [Morchella snyderi]
MDNLPAEIILLIVETPAFPLNTFNALIRTNRTFHDLLTPHLYKRASELASSPLHWSAARGFRNNIAPLVAAGCDIEVKDWTNRTPLMAAALSNHLNTVRALLDNGANINGHSGRFNDDGTALHLVARDGSFEMVALLLDYGADVNVREARGATPLHWAVDTGGQGTENADELLLGYGVGSNTVRESVVELLLDRGAQIDTDREQDGDTALRMAITRGNVRMFEMLLRRGANIEIRARLGETALMSAVACERMDMVSALLERGAMVGCRNDYGETALHYAAVQTDSGEMLKVLLDGYERSSEIKEAGFIDIQNDEGNTALHLATRDEARKMRIEAGKALQQLQAEEPASDGETRICPAYAMQKRAETNLTASVGLLLERGASPDCASEIGRRPLHNAAANGYVQMTQVLLDYGAEIDATDVDGVTPLVRAGRVSWTVRKKPEQLEGRIGVVRLLRQSKAICDGIQEWVEGNQALSDALGEYDDYDMSSRSRRIVIASHENPVRGLWDMTM